MAWVGEITLAERRSGVLCVFHAMGDLGSGLGPLFAYRLVESVDIGVVYGVCAVLLLLLVLPILRARQQNAVSSGV